MKTDIKTFNTAYTAPTCSVYALKCKNSVATGSFGINKLDAEDADEDIIDF